MHQTANRGVRAGIPGAALTQATLGAAYFFTPSFGSFTSGMVDWISTGSTIECSVGINASGFLFINRGALSGGTTLATSSTPLVLNTWYFIECECVFSDTVGRISVYVNGALLFQVTSADVLVTAAATITAFQVNNGAGTEKYVDDLYITDTATRLGECRVETLRPSADTAQKDFVPNSGATNFSRVNEVLVDADTSYVSSSTVNAEDLYELDNLSSTPSQIFAVQNRMVARKDDAATRVVQNRLKSGSAATVGGASFNLSSSYGIQVDIYELNPDGSVAWTGAAVNALQVGQKITT